ncbi:HEPN domain-containing protein [Parvibaculum sp.]|uniref:HEPN domain-containing protein n=1 Tax=Parvibaculum sp. TaxID=2024848 RepID=UPI001DB08557|nr:HEPN domain-containing protein [Parvibaculum sp.]MBX3490310.1 hypothetical protein [Parvibaculum sp.]
MAFGPMDAANSCIRRSRRFLSLANAALDDTKIKNDLRRTALVMSVTAVDAYMHWLVFRRLSEVRYEGDLPKSLSKLNVPFSSLASLADALIAARHSDRNIRPWVQVKNAIQRELLKETFQNYEQIGNALSLAGIERGLSRTATEMGSTATEIRERLNRLVHRRNQVVHEGDFVRAHRPRKSKYNKIKHKDVVDDVEWIERLLQSINNVVEATRLVPAS